MASVRNIAPFINDEFVITSKWWNERINPVTGELEIHRGLDIATSGSKPVYSILKGIIHSKGTSDFRGNWVIVKDNNESSSTYGYATLYMHLAESVSLPVNASVDKGTFLANEGTTGQSTGIHLHVEMQDLNRWGNVWHTSYVKSDYLDPTVYMGIDNIEGTSWIYDGTPIPPEPPITDGGKKKKFPWFIYNRKKIWY
ncbi:MAG: M23 family metallopeptidase [archaeon]|nr:M23 family metallopeptidase [archaeon]